MVVATSLNPASDAVYVGPSRERTANGRAVALASTGYIAAIDEKAWAGPRRSARASRVPHSVSRIATETAREQSTRGARSSHPFGAGLDRSPVAAAGDRL